MTDPFLGHRLVAAARLDRWERQMRRAARLALANQRARALARLRSMTAAGPPRAVPPDPFDEVTWSDEIDATVAPVARSVLDDVVSAVYGALRPGTGSPLPQPDLTGRLDRLIGSMRGLGADMSASLGRTLTDGVAHGESIDDLSDRVIAVFDGTGDARAQTISRTEVVGAANGAAMDAAGVLAADGTEMTKTWLATSDDRTRDDHAEADGQTVAYDDTFDVGGEELMYPGDENGSPDNVINCRCTVIFDVPDGATQPVDTVGDDEA